MRKDSKVLINTLLAICIAMVLPLFCFGAGPSLINHSQGGALSVSSFTQVITNTASGNVTGYIFPLTDAASGRTPTSIKWGGTSMTELVGARSDDGTTKQSGCWYLNSPPANSNNVVITWSGSVVAMACIVGVLQGVDQTTTIDQTNNASGGSSSTTAVCVMTNTYNNSFTTDGMYKQLTSGSVTAGGSQTVVDNGAVGSAFSGASSYLTTNPALGAVSNSWTFSIASAYQMSYVSFKAAPVANATQPSLPLIGVGP